MNDSQWKVFHSDDNIQSVNGPPPEWTELTNMDTQNPVFENWNTFTLSLTEAAYVLSSDPTTVESRTWSSHRTTECHYNSNSSTFIKDRSTEPDFSIESNPKISLDLMKWIESAHKILGREDYDFSSLFANNDIFSLPDLIFFVNTSNRSASIFSDVTIKLKAIPRKKFQLFLQETLPVFNNNKKED